MLAETFAIKTNFQTEWLTHAESGFKIVLLMYVCIPRQPGVKYAIFLPLRVPIISFQISFSVNPFVSHDVLQVIFWTLWVFRWNLLQHWHFSKFQCMLLLM